MSAHLIRPQLPNRSLSGDQLSVRSRHFAADNILLCLDIINSTVLAHAALGTGAIVAQPP